MLAFFPLHKQRNEIERCADILDSHHGENANRIWRAEMMSMADRLREKGADEDEVSAQIRAFNDAVQMELQRRWLNSLQASP